MNILDGKKLNAEINLQLKSEVDSFSEFKTNKPKLVIFQVGDIQASNIYISRKIKFAEEIGVECEVIKFTDDISETEILDVVNSKNRDKSVTGMILQLPIPEHLNSRKIINSFDSNKDVDGLGDTNISKLVNNDKTGIVPATARGIEILLNKNNIEIEGKKICIIGRSVLVGKSTALNLINHNATVTICHSKTKSLKDELLNADIIISAAGQPNLIREEHVNPNQIIVDVSINIVDNKMIGDVDKNISHENVAGISLVPGGVGPMTVASLFLNLIDSFKIQNNI
jgi:methylenetetrahydrofolate dehydrogenase (NADP+)/methenyltetrahydrofolate cyclohydrolase